MIFCTALAKGFVMQAVILAAGMGKRLKNHTKNQTKCLVQVNGKPLIYRALEALLHHGITEIGLVVGYQAESLKNYVANHFPEASITVIENPLYDQTNNIYSLWLANEFFAKDDTVLLEGDIIFETDLLTALLEAPEPDLAVVSKYESWMDGTVTVLGDDHTVLNVVDKKKFDWDDTAKYYKTVNIYKFSREYINQYYLPFLEAYIRSFGQNEYYEQVLKVLVFLEQTGLKAMPVDAGCWYEIDTPHDLEIAETRFASPEIKLARLQARYGGYWNFPELIDYCYLVNPFFPPQRLVDEIQASFTLLLTQYPSGMKVQQLLAAQTFGVAANQLVVGNGAAELIAQYLHNEKGRIGIPIPTFHEYSARVPGDRLVEIRTSRQGFAYSVEELLEQSLGKVDTLVLVNPDNPSGHFLENDKMLCLLTACENHGVRLVVDESFADFADKDAQYTLLHEEFLEQHPTLTVIKSISKSYGVPGLRLGILASGDTRRIKTMIRELPVWNINSFGEFFLQIISKYGSDYQHACRQLAAERERFSSRLREIHHLDVFPSQANYLLCSLPEQGAALVVERLLAEHHLLIKDLSTKRGFENLRTQERRMYFRVAVRSPLENNFFVHAMKTVVKHQFETVRFPGVTMPSLRKNTA